LQIANEGRQSLQSRRRCALVPWPAALHPFPRRSGTEPEAAASGGTAWTRGARADHRSRS